jgi:hypothetical protein
VRKPFSPKAQKKIDDLRRVALKKLKARRSASLAEYLRLQPSRPTLLAVQRMLADRAGVSVDTLTSDANEVRITFKSFDVDGLWFVSTIDAVTCRKKEST